VPAPERRAPVAAAASQVRVEIATDPPGAYVFLDGEMAPRGITPLTLELLRDARAHALRLAARNRAPLATELIANEDQRLHLTLPPRAAPPPRAPPPTPRAPNLRHVGVVDPFGP
jgi:hypothetical protein